MKLPKKPLKSASLIATLLFISANPFSRGIVRQPATAQLSKSSVLLTKAEDDYWNHALNESLLFRLRFGLKIEKLPDLSFEYSKSQAGFAASILERLKDIKREELNHDETISLDILKWENLNTVEGLAYYWLGFPVTPYASPIPGVISAFKKFPIAGSEDLAHYLGLLKKVPFFIDGILNKLRGQYGRGIIIPREELDMVIPILDSYVKEGEESEFFVKNERLKTLPPPEAKKFQQQLVGIINNEANRALDQLSKFLKGHYLQKAPRSVGLWQYPGGREYYRYLIKAHTGLTLSPEQIHQMGLAEIKKNMGRLAEIKDSVGFKGSLAEFRQFLRKDPRFFPKTAGEIEARLLGFVNGLNEKIDGYFMKRPQSPYGVKRLALELEPGMSFGFYQDPTVAEPVGIYYFNGSKLNERSLLMAEGLIYHELVPGHYFQRTLQQENRNLPEFQRASSDNGYIEGWAEYASWLGQEMGFFRDPYSLCGRILMDIFISTRLVADTGMNYLEWPRSRAIDFMKETVIESETQINTETLRYSVDIPGQALSYKLGLMKMFELREKAQKALGDKFNIRKFHEAILGNGSMPLSVLEKHIDWYIEKEKAAPSASTKRSKSTVTVDGTPISYSVEGEGLPCLVVNGSLYPKTFSEKLKKHFRFVFVEYRNMYVSDPPADVPKITLDTLVDDIEQVRQKLGYEKIAVLGHSVPGFIAPEYARKYPQHVSHIILIAMPPRWTEEYQRESQDFWKADASQERKAVFQHNQKENTEERLKGMPPGEAWAVNYNANSPMYFYDPSYDSRWLWEGIEFNRDFVNHLLGKILAGHDISDIFLKIKVPVFLALGRYSYITPYHSWDAIMKTSPNITFGLFEKSGHYPMLEEADLFDEKIMAWMGMR